MAGIVSGRMRSRKIGKPQAVDDRGSHQDESEGGPSDGDMRGSFGGGLCLCELHRFLLPIPFKAAAFQFRRRIEISLRPQHFLNVRIDAGDVFGAIDGVQPQGLISKQDQDDVGERTRPQAAGDGEMKSPADAARFPLGFEFLERQGRKAFFGSSAAAAETDEEVTILNANLFGGSIGAGDGPQRALGA
jgi:hypothetical protein